MDVFEAVSTRRAIKKFDPNHKMSPEEVKKLMEHVILSPTSYNQQNWRFIYVTDQDVKEKVSEAARGQAQPKDGSLVVVLCGDMTAWKTEPLRYWKNHPTEKQEMVKASLERKYSTDTQAQRDEAIRSCGMAAQTIMLAARDMGLDSCPMVGFEYDELAKVINLPENHLIVMMVVVGKKAEDAAQRGGQLPLNEVAFENKF
ncbi:putative NADH nitroreductase YdgI protein [Marine Group I thaumarchaeote SCGC AAA799-E16]|uniref:NADH dehydrogenase protein n=5 Tax=Marine Group I TaxID=905826 RepID=A0A087S019_9ARCH|nr:Putative NADH nitroreductase YdgI protein [Marine Group I thaumarchaeote SCGC AAA799-N04]KER06369.1 putative NADH nitroreductase YdgI protein [Marine Group I thaumarchaeote SCGC AAA799-E16]KFM17216.1 putative NADH nitroreductase YdgI protein [Marine Group I thaumarchaeote SCGC AAA799-D11]KFM19073.1 NADH dehydrogenase protein [Marine Group I thaumarchaeote SCGC RSA3]KFM22066.1 putative NADH nitroreductase YdgI protein [Marine Group I thaumarchaeote SCGC AAA799-B03]